MKQFFDLFKYFYGYLRLYIPVKLPVGVEEFEKWSKDIVESVGLPDNDSTKFALATMILHLEATSKIEVNLLFFKVLIPTSAYKSRAYFAQAMAKSAANQIAASIMQDLKQKQTEKLKAEAQSASNQQ